MRTMDDRKQRLAEHAKARAGNTCDKCFYIDSVEDGFEFKGGGEWYYCKRYPPVVISGFDGPEVAFPTVSLDDWCGEFRRE